MAEPSFWKANEYMKQHPFIEPDRWFRTCPQCGVYLWKTHLNDVLTCACGWIWGK
jgi:hypothetical protein